MRKISMSHSVCDLFPDGAGAQIRRHSPTPFPPTLGKRQIGSTKNERSRYTEHSECQLNSSYGENHLISFTFNSQSINKFDLSPFVSANPFVCWYSIAVCFARATERTNEFEFDVWVGYKQLALLYSLALVRNNIC